MPTWSSRGLRGSTLEDFINHTNDIYSENDLALIQKIPTPITPINIDHATRHITLAYFDQKSTVDYIGVVQGVPVCFDAKECANDTFPLANIHKHQMDFMHRWQAQEGIAFFLLYFSIRDEYYYLTLDLADTFFQRMESGGRKSFRINELDLDYFFSGKPGVPVPYLEMIQKDMDRSIA